MGIALPLLKPLPRPGTGLLLGLLLTVYAHAAQTLSDGRSGPDPELRKILVAAIADSDSFADRFDAEVWLTDMSHRLSRQVPDAEERLHILKAVHRQAKLAGVEPELVLAVIDVESNFDRYAISTATALGLMQVMPFWPRQLGMTNQELVRIPQNLRMGCTILKFYLDRERGDYTRALARYNGSVGRRNYADLVLERLARRWHYN